MTEAIERMARAIAEYTGQRLPPQGDIVTCEGIARAALLAIRDSILNELRMTAVMNGEAEPAWQDGFAHAIFLIDTALSAPQGVSDEPFR